MSEFTKDKVKSLHEALRKTVEQFAAEHGVSGTVGRCTYDAKTMTVKVELGADAAAGKFPKERAQWGDYSTYRTAVDKVADAALDATFTYGGHTYVVVGYEVKRRKSPIVTEQQGTGRVTYFPSALFLGCAPQFRFPKMSVPESNS